MKLLSASFLLFLFVGTAWPQTSSGRGSIAGRVTHNGKGVKGVTVSLRLETSSSQSNAPQMTETNPDGEYHFGAVADGSYNLEIASTNQYALAGSMTDRRWHTVVIENGAAVRDIDFTVDLGGVITGTVKDAKGKPVIEASIELKVVNEKKEIIASSLYFPNQSERQTDDRGVYRIYGVPAGRYLVGVRPRQAKGEQDIVLHPAAKDAAQASVVEVAAGAETADVDITLPAPEKGYTLTGRVLDAETQRPVADLQVRYTKYELITSGDQTYPKQLSADRVHTDAQGKFVFKDVTAGKYSVFADSFTEPKYSDPALLDVTQTDVQDVELKLIKGATIRGRILIEGGSEAADFTKLRLSVFVINHLVHRTNRGNGAKIHPDGSYEMEGLVSGEVHISISSADDRYSLLRLEKNGAIVDQRIKITASEVLTDVNVVLAVGKGSVKGQVMVEGKKPPGVCFNIFADRIGRPGENTGYNGDSADVDAQGRFVFDRLPPGEYELIADPEYTFRCGSTVTPRFATVRQRIRIADKQEQRVTMVIKFDNQ